MHLWIVPTIFSAVANVLASTIVLEDGSNGVLSRAPTGQFAQSLSQNTKQQISRQRRTTSLTLDPFDDSSASKDTMVHGTAEFVFMFRKAGRRIQNMIKSGRAVTGFVLELAEFRISFNDGWHGACRQWCHGYNESVEHGISPFVGCCAVHVMFQGVTCGSARAATDRTFSQPCLEFKRKAAHLPPSRERQTKHQSASDKAVHVAIAGGMLDAVGIVVAVWESESF